MTIVVTCLGYIKTSLGREIVELPGSEITASDLIEKVRGMAKERDDARLVVGFTRHNTLLVVNGDSAFTAADDNRKIQDGDEVMLIPFSHGG